MFKFVKLLKSLLQGAQIFVIFHFAILKRTISNNYGTKYPILIDVASSVLTIYFLAFSLTVLSICGCYKLLVYTYLLIRHGRRFHGMITGMDMLTILAPGCKGPVLGITRCSTDQPFNSKEVYSQICEQINKSFFLKTVNRKFFSTREYTKLGYHYFTETVAVQVEDIVKYIKAPNKDITEPIEEDELQSLATSYFNSDLPAENKFNWDICLCLNPIVDAERSKQGRTKFAIFTRMHHTLGDGLVIFNIMVHNLFQFGPEFKSYSENLVNRCKNIEKEKTPGKHVYKFGKKILIEKPCILRDGERHVRSIYTNRVEEPSSQTYLDKVKIIREKYPGIMTFNILMTAYSAALAEFYLKYSPKMGDIPETLEATHPVQLDIRRYLDIYASSESIKLSNEVSSFQFTCPIIPRNKRDVPIKDYLVDRMLILKEDFDRALSSMDIQANYIWSSIYYSVFPYQITRNLFDGVFITTLTTCMPGGPRLKLFNNDNIEDITYLLSKQYYSTLMLSINTYDRRLQVGLTASEDKIRTVSKLNEIRDGIFKYLDLLYKQCINE